MIQNRVLAILLLFILIPIGFLLIFRSGLPFSHSLRRDSVPNGTYVIPWMTPTQSPSALNAIPLQSQPWNLSAAMLGSLRLDVSFNIVLPNGTRSVSSTIFLGHDFNLLYVGGIFRGVYSNPTSSWDSNHSNFHAPANYLKVLFDPDNDGVLNAPESGSGPYAFLACPFNPSQCGLGSNGWGSGELVAGYVDLAWVNYVKEYGHGIFDLASNVCNQPSTVAGLAEEYNYITGDLVVFFARRLDQPNSCANGLQIQAGERWVMGFLLELGYANEAAPLTDYTAGWPLKAYPYLTNAASSWPKLVIDLGVRS